MPKDTKAGTRLTTLFAALGPWVDALDDGQRATPADGTTVGDLATRTLARQHVTARLDPDAALLAEAGVVTAVDALARALPDAPPPLPRPSLAGAVRTTLFRLEAQHPGHLVEVRVPPFGAVQIGVPGVDSVHRRGTPPNVVETDASTWLRLAAGSLTWADAIAAHRVSASGAHAQLGDVLPVG